MSMIWGSLLATALISIILIAGLRSFRYGLISLLPNAFPAAMIYGLWGLSSGEVNMAVTVTFSVSLGIIVDDTVHILSKYLSARRRGESPEQAIESTFRLTGAALLVTSAFLVSALLIQSQSEFGITSTLGRICAPIVAVALLFDFFCLPALLLRFPGSPSTSATGRS
jgi:predicted RND superfamily exporter protein